MKKGACVTNVTVQVYLLPDICTMKLNRWNFIRVIRLLLGVSILIQGFYTMEVAFILLGIVFTAMPILNIGCCATGSCEIQQKSTNGQFQKETIEEIKLNS